MENLCTVHSVRKFFVFLQYFCGGFKCLYVIKSD